MPGRLCLHWPHGPQRVEPVVIALPASGMIGPWQGSRMDAPDVGASASVAGTMVLAA